MPIDSAVFEELSRTAEAIVTGSRRPPSVPSHQLPLFHYTDVRAFSAIVETGHLWATHIAYMNDASELSYGASVLTDETTRRLRASPSSTARMFLERAALVFTNDLFQDFYVTCFCEAGDLLSQWRGYGANNGYAIGFHHGILRTACSAAVMGSDGPIRIPYELVQVTYDVREQAQLIAAILDEAERIALGCVTTDGVVVPEDVVPRVLSAIAPSVVRAFATMKNPVFSAEKEWRLIYSSGPLDRFLDAGAVTFRVADAHLVPYLNVNVCGAGTPLGRLPIESVVVGPTATPTLARQAAIALLRQTGYSSSSNVTSSTIPLRK